MFVQLVLRIYKIALAIALIAPSLRENTKNINNKIFKNTILPMLFLTFFSIQSVAQTTPEQLGNVLVQSLIDNDEATYLNLLPTYDEILKSYSLKINAPEEDKPLIKSSVEQYLKEHLAYKKLILEDAQKYQFDWTAIKSTDVSYKKEQLTNKDNFGKTIVFERYLISIVVNDGNQDLKLQIDDAANYDSNFKFGEIKYWYFSSVDSIYLRNTPNEFVASYTKALQTKDEGMLRFLFPTFEESLYISKKMTDIITIEDRDEFEEYIVESWFEYKVDLERFYAEMEEVAFDLKQARIEPTITLTNYEIEASKPEIPYHSCTLLFYYDTRILRFTFSIYPTNNGYKIIDDIIMWNFRN